MRTRDKRNRGQVQEDRVDRFLVVEPVAGVGGQNAVVNEVPRGGASKRRRSRIGQVRARHGPERLGGQRVARGGVRFVGVAYGVVAVGAFPEAELFRDDFLAVRRRQRLRTQHGAQERCVSAGCAKTRGGG